MKLSNIPMFASAAACALMLTPALAATDTAGAGRRNLTQEQQQAGAVVLPSFARLAQQVLPPLSIFQSN